VRAELFHADRRKDGYTDMTKLIMAFQHFANAQKKTRTIKFGGKDKVCMSLLTSKLNDTGARDGEEVRCYMLQTNQTEIRKFKTHYQLPYVKPKRSLTDRLQAANGVSTALPVYTG